LHRGAEEDDMQSSRFRIGHDVGAFGRWTRLVLGVGGTAWATNILLGAGLALESAAWIGAIAIAYLLGHRLVLPLLDRASPWLGSIVFVGPAIIIPMLGSLPPGLRLGMVVYFSLSLILTAVTRYGGCEVMALPSLLFKRWYTVYCPVNVIDAVERRVGRSNPTAPERSERAV
jgi:hypothetical protein